MAVPDYPQLAALLRGLGYPHDPANFHGAVCGALCVQSPEQIDFTRLLGEPGATIGPAAAEDFATLRDAALAAMSDMQTGFMPLLPEDDIELGERARALAQWCEGFLYGLAGGRALQLDETSDELREVIGDFAEFTRAGLREGDDVEVEEGAYAELVEYIRVGAQLVFMELRAARQQPEPESRTLH